MQYLIQQLCSIFSWDLCKNPVFQSAKKSKYYLERSYLEMPFCMYNISSRSLPVQRSYFPSYTCNEVKLLCIIDSMKLSTSDRIAARSAKPVCAWLTLMQRVISTWTCTNTSLAMQGWKTKPWRCSQDSNACTPFFQHFICHHFTSLNLQLSE